MQSDLHRRIQSLGASRRLSQRFGDLGISFTQTRKVDLQKSNLFLGKRSANFLYYGQNARQK
jgi:hypothetical protein